MAKKDTSVQWFDWRTKGSVKMIGEIGQMIKYLDCFLINGTPPVAFTSITVLDGKCTMRFPVTVTTSEDTVPQRMQVVEVITQTGTVHANLKSKFKVDASGHDGVTGWVEFTDDSIPNGTYGGGTWNLPPVAGWIKMPLPAVANKAAYKSTAADANGYILYVDDTLKRVCEVFGCKSLASLDKTNLVDRFPITREDSWWCKKNEIVTADNVDTAVQRTSIYGDSRFFLLCSSLQWTDLYTGSTPRGNKIYVFGDYTSRRPQGDVFATYLGSVPGTMTNAASDSSFNFMSGTSNIATARDFQGTGMGFLETQQPWLPGGTSLSGGATTLGNFPSAVTGDMILCKMRTATTGNSGDTTAPRAEMPGAWYCPQRIMDGALVDGEEIILENGHVGRARPLATQGVARGGWFVMDVEGPWR